MHICIHDFAGHPFTVELAREMARQGHKITYAWFAGDTGPKGVMSKLGDDPENLFLFPLGEHINYSKRNFLKRRSGDKAYGKVLAERISTWKPDVVISGNTPTEAQEFLIAGCIRLRIPFVYWCQDFYSIAATKILRKKLPVLGEFIGFYYRFLEKRQMQRATHIVHITEAFFRKTDEWAIDRSKIHLIENWGLIAQIPQKDRNNDWATRNSLKDGTRFLYSGTLALKHNPQFLAKLAEEIADGDEVIVVSAGVGFDDLVQMKQQRNLKNLKCLDLQPFSDLPEVLGSADVFLGVIESDAGEFSVPSKVLSYLCAGKPIILAAPSDNLAAKIVTDTKAGNVVRPDDINGFIRETIRYRDNPAARKLDGDQGRKYAKRHFDIEKIGKRFEILFESCLRPTPTDG